MLAVPNPLRSNAPEVWPWTDITHHPVKDDAPLISIVVPSYNQGEYLEETLRSILAQQYAKLELIVIDGGSTDNSVEILQHYDAHIAYWVSEPDKGQADALNKGFTRATGELCNWINSDDLLTPSALHKVAAAAREADVVAAVTQDFDPANRTRNLVTHGFEFAELVRQGAGGKVLWHQPSIWVRRALLKAGYPLSLDLHYKFDFELFLKVLAQKPRVAYIDDIVARFRLHDSSKTVSNQMGFLADHVAVLEAMLDYPPAAEWHAQTQQALDSKRWQLALAQLTGDGSRSRWARLAELRRLIQEAGPHRCNASSRRAARRILLRGVHQKRAKRPRRFPWQRQPR